VKDKIGYQIGLASSLPLGEVGMIELIVSALEWQETSGPCIIFVDEPFYRFLLRTKIEDIYQDVIPLPEGSDMDVAMQYVRQIFPIEPTRVPSGYINASKRSEVDSHLNDIPEDIKERWQDMLLNEEMILSLSQLNPN
jgi:hypothetical protein